MSTRYHGLFDYLFAFALMSSWFVNYCRDKIALDLLAVTGLFIIVLSQLTRYEFGLIKLIPMKAHLCTDVGIAVFLFILPFVFHYPNYWPVFFAMLQLSVVFISETNYDNTL